jgi:hypothetical protein
MAGKYDALREHLANAEAEAVFLTFAEIEAIIGDRLPDSARSHLAWWANASAETGHPYSEAWTSTGRKASAVNLTAEIVVFERGSASDSG